MCVISQLSFWWFYILKEKNIILNKSIEGKYDRGKSQPAPNSDTTVVMIPGLQLYFQSAI